MSPAPAKPGGKPGGKKVLLGLSPKVWVGVLALGVIIFLYIRHKNSSAAATAGAPAAADPTDTMSAADTASLAAGLGGTPGAATGGFDASWLASLFDQQTNSLEQFASNYGLMAGAGISPGGSGVSTMPPTPAVGSPIVVNPTAAPAAQQPAATDSANLATSFYPPDSNAAVGGSAPLYAYNGGNLIAESPIAGSAFSVFAPASEGYEALGVHASDPITFTPTTMGTSTAPPIIAPPRTGGRIAV